ncbi:hypothetical protein PSTG_07691 [Puccinia striiformis f. sp. tritici PST-78]|uniref:Uncharacterized protein n=1 Tax=Puccinia striiformis f. sp. tritici PST-78 TaxID=1165861 RepID=A0A0L0VIF0_9BASI|nr:hypothetical protein PSTG_07691 [Puccinia striiformis f. sp. tritici PST-78]
MAPIFPDTIVLSHATFSSSAVAGGHYRLLKSDPALLGKPYPGVLFDATLSKLVQCDIKQAYSMSWPIHQLDWTAQHAIEPACLMPHQIGFFRGGAYEKPIQAARPTRHQDSLSNMALNTLAQ